MQVKNIRKSSVTGYFADFKAKSVVNTLFTMFNSRYRGAVFAHDITPILPAKDR